MIIYDWFDIQWLKNYYNFGFDHFNMSRKKTDIWGLMRCLTGKLGPFASGDWILPDLTIEGTIALNSRTCTFPDTYYFSYATKRTRKVLGITVPSGLLGIHPLLFIRVLQMSQWRYPAEVAPPYKGYRLVICSLTSCGHNARLEFKHSNSKYGVTLFTGMKIGGTTMEQSIPYP